MSQVRWKPREEEEEDEWMIESCRRRRQQQQQRTLAKDDDDLECERQRKNQSNTGKRQNWMPTIGRRKARKTALQAPLRTVPVSTPTGVESRMVYMPFSTTDLLNWQEKTPRLRDDPEKVYQRFNTIFLTYDPTWVDCNMLIEMLLAPDEHRLVLDAAKQYLHNTVQKDPDEYFTVADPKWDLEKTAGKKKLSQMREALLIGVKTAIPKTYNWNKVHVCTQKPEEHPSDFLMQLLMEIEWQTSIDPNLPENQEIVNQIYAAQAAPDIKRKLMQIDGFELKATNDIVRIATKVYVRRQERLENNWTGGKMKGSRTMAYGGGQQKTWKGNKQSEKLQKNQCAFCKKIWPLEERLKVPNKTGRETGNNSNGK